jgi:hypothetical protein
LPNGELTLGRGVLNPPPHDGNEGLSVEELIAELHAPSKEFSLQIDLADQLLVEAGDQCV